MSDDPEPVFKTPRQQLLRDVLLYGSLLGLLVWLQVSTDQLALSVTVATLAAGVVGVSLGVLAVAADARMSWGDSLFGRLFFIVVGITVVTVIQLIVSESMVFFGIGGLVCGVLLARVVGYLR